MINDSDQIKRMVGVLVIECVAAPSAGWIQERKRTLENLIEFLFMPIIFITCIIESSLVCYALTSFD